MSIPTHCARVSAIIMKGWCIVYGARCRRNTERFQEKSHCPFLSRMRYERGGLQRSLQHSWAVLPSIPSPQHSPGRPLWPRQFQVRPDQSPPGVQEAWRTKASSSVPDSELVDVEEVTSDSRDEKRGRQNVKGDRVGQVDRSRRGCRASPGCYIRLVVRAGRGWWYHVGGDVMKDRTHWWNGSVGRTSVRSGGVDGRRWSNLRSELSLWGERGRNVGLERKRRRGNSYVCMCVYVLRASVGFLLFFPGSFDWDWGSTYVTGDGRIKSVEWGARWAVRNCWVTDDEGVLDWCPSLLKLDLGSEELVLTRKWGSLNTIL